MSNLLRNKKKLSSVRIELPKGFYYDTLELGAKIHNAPSLSKYILTAALSYTKQFLEERTEQLKGQNNEEDNKQDSEQCDTHKTETRTEKNNSI